MTPEKKLFTKLAASAGAILLAYLMLGALIGLAAAHSRKPIQTPPISIGGVVIDNTTDLPADSFRPHFHNPVICFTPEMSPEHGICWEQKPDLHLQ
jgi:hypothetical protein